MVETVYNPQVVPMYIGIFATDADNAKKQVVSHSQYCLQSLREKYPEDEPKFTDEHNAPRENRSSIP